MADLKVLGEFGYNDTVLALENASKCIAGCRWCYRELSRKLRPPRPAGSTFEAALAKAHSPAYDPSDFLQWGLRHKLPLCWSSGVEPFQDAAQARAILKACADLGQPLFLQTRGTNWREVWGDVLPLAGNAMLYVSLPTLDQAVIRRFEPGTPPVAERLALLRAAAEAGIPTTLGQAPYHPDWAPDPTEVLREVASYGLHTPGSPGGLRLAYLGSLRLGGDLLKALHPNDHATRDAGTTRREWLPRLLDHAEAHREATLALGTVGWHSSDEEAMGRWLTPIPPADPHPYRDAYRWPYSEAAFHDPIAEVYLEPGDPGTPILTTFADAWAAMEATGTPTRQAFRWTTLGGFLRRAKRLPPPVIASLRPAATLRKFFRAIWNDPHRTGFAWRGQFCRAATRPDGSYWRDGRGDVVMVTDPFRRSASNKHPLPTLDGMRRWRGAGVMAEA